MLKRGPIQDFLENGFNHFAGIGKLNEANDALQNEGSPMFWKIMDLGFEVLDPQDNLGIGWIDFKHFGNLDVMVSVKVRV